MSAQMSELEQKRLAVLASLKKNRSHSHSPRVVPPQLPNNASSIVEVNNETTNEKQKENTALPNMDTMLDAVLDLRRLGYSFDRIVAESGVSRRFLEMCYKHWEFPALKPPVVDTAVLAPVATAAIAIAKPKGAVENRYTSTPTPTPTPTPVINARPRFNNKYVRQMDRPEWMKNLVISLESSDEEEEDSEEDSNDSEDDDSDADQQGEVVQGEDHIHESSKRPASADNAHDDSLKKRKLNVDYNESLNDVALRKKQVSLKIDLLSNKIKTFDETRAKLYDQEITLKEKNIASLDTQVTQLEKTLQQLRTLLSSDIDAKDALVKEKQEYDSLKESLANGMIEVETLEQTELKLKEANRLRAKNNRKKSVTPNPGNGTTNDNNTARNPILVSDETIHKIPKVIYLTP